MKEVVDAVACILPYDSATIGSRDWLAECNICSSNQYSDSCWKDLHGLPNIPEKRPGLADFDSCIQSFTTSANECLRVVIDLTDSIRLVEITVEPFIDCQVNSL
jgi:hypothetical protein